MIKHIVMWLLKEKTAGHSKEENSSKHKTMLEALKGKIQEINDLEVRIDFNRSEPASVLCI